MKSLYLPTQQLTCVKTQVVQQNHQTQTQTQTQTHARGRWSNPERTSSVDLDELIAAPSPPPSATRRRKKSSGADVKKQKSTRAKTHRLKSNHEQEAVDLDEVLAGDVDVRKLQKQSERKRREVEKQKKKLLKQKLKEQKRKAKRNKKRQDASEGDATYHSYDDPGYLATDPIELTHFDSDLILGSPLNSPSVIHARWGEPVDDPDEEAVCVDFEPNPFKLGFCVNCQKQHEVTDSGSVVIQKNYKKIARPAVAKTAANAAENPAAVKNAAPRSKAKSHAGASSSSARRDSSGGRESDVDLALLLRQRRDILLKLGKIEQEKARLKDQRRNDSSASRHTMCLSDSNSLAQLRRLATTTAATVTTTTTTTTTSSISRSSSLMVSSDTTSSIRGLSKSISLVPDAPLQNDWC